MSKILSSLRFPRAQRWSLALSLSGLILYIATLLPGIDWNYGARSQLRAYTAEWDSSVLGSPVYYGLGSLFGRIPAGDPAWRINFSSALYGAAALYFFALAGFALLRIMESEGSGAPRAPLPTHVGAGGGDGDAVHARATCWSVVLASAALAVSHTFWFSSTHPRVESMASLVLAAALCCALLLIRRASIPTLLLLSFLVGLTSGVDLYAVTLLPIFLLVMVAACRSQSLACARVLPAAGACFLLGSAPYLFALFRDIARTKLPLLTLGLVTGPAMQGPGGVLRGAENIGRMLFAVGYDFLPWGAAVGVAGFFRLRRQALLLWLLGGGLSITAVSVLLRAGGADPARRYSMTILYGLLLFPGWRQVVGRWPGLAWPALLTTLLAPPVLYASAPHLALTAPIGLRHALAPGQAQDTEMNVLRYYLSAGGREEDSAGRFGRDLLGQLPLNATLLAQSRTDDSAYFIIRFLQQAEHLRPDVSVESLIGYAEPVPLRQFFELKPETAALYLIGREELYDAAHCAIEPLPRVGEQREGNLMRAVWAGSSTAIGEIPREDSYWSGKMTLLQSGLGLNVTYAEGLWYARLRLDHPLLYPREARVDHLQVQRGRIAFTHAGLSFTARIFDDRLLGEWIIPSLPEWHGQWQAGRIGN